MGGAALSALSLKRTSTRRTEGMTVYAGIVGGEQKCAVWTFAFAVDQNQ